MGKMIKTLLSEEQYGDYIRRKGLEKYVQVQIQGHFSVNFVSVIIVRQTLIV
jgi:hypothetical protein